MTERGRETWKEGGRERGRGREGEGEGGREREGGRHGKRDGRGGRTYGRYGPRKRAPRVKSTSVVLSLFKDDILK